MKNDDQMYQSVLSRRQEYRGKKKKRIRIIRFAAPIAACGCLALMLGIRFSGTVIDLPDIPVQPSSAITSVTAVSQSTTAKTTAVTTAKTTAVTKATTAVPKTEAPTETEEVYIPEETEYYEPEPTEAPTEYVPPEPQYGDDNGRFVSIESTGGEIGGDDPYGYIELNGEIYTNTHTVRMGAPRSGNDHTPIYYPGTIDGLPYRYSGDGEIEVLIDYHWTVFRKE